MGLKKEAARKSIKAWSWKGYTLYNKLRQKFYDRKPQARLIKYTPYKYLCAMLLPEYHNAKYSMWSKRPLIVRCFSCHSICHTQYIKLCCLLHWRHTMIGKSIEVTRFISTHCYQNLICGHRKTKAWRLHISVIACSFSQDYSKGMWYKKHERQSFISISNHRTQRVENTTCRVVFWQTLRCLDS